MQKQVYRCPNHTTNLNNMRLNNKLCDITIEVHGIEFRAHRSILAANLQYFEMMLLNDSFQESKQGFIKMDSITATDLELFITYAYTGEITLTESNALDLLEVANYLGVVGIKDACINFLEKHLRLEDALRTYQFADAIGHSLLKNLAKSKILFNFRNFSQFMDLDFESLKDIVSGIEFDHSHWREILFEGIMKWIMHDAKNRKMYMKDLFYCINATMLNSDYFLKYVGTIANDENDDGIVKDSMSCYHNLLLNPTCNQNQETKPLVEYSKQALVVIESQSGNSEFLRMQFYNFMESKDQ